MKWNNKQYELFLTVCALLCFLFAKIQNNQSYNDNLMCFGLCFTAMYCAVAITNAFSSFTDWMVGKWVNRKYR